MDLQEIKEEVNEIEDSDVRTAQEIIATLEGIVGDLKHTDPSLIQQAVDQFLSKEDIDEMVTIYHNCFDKYPNNNSIKQYVLHLFNMLYIPIYKVLEDGTMVYEDYEEDNSL